MATFIEKHPEKLLTCPFNSIHKVKPIRYQQHIFKCQKTSKVKPETFPHKISKEEYDQHAVNSSAKKDITPNVCLEFIPTFTNSSTNEYNQENDWESSCSPFVTSGLEKAKVNKKLIESKHLNPFTIQRLSKSERKHLYAKRVEYFEAQSKLKAKSADKSEIETIKDLLTSQPVNPEPDIWYQESPPISKTSDS